MEKVVITISREFGSGGRRIGELAAKKLNIKFYDRTLIDLAADASGLSANFVRENEQKFSSSFFFNLAVSGWDINSLYSKDNMPLPDNLFLAQSRVIKEIAEKEPCVIVGRCANYILRERTDCLNVFIHSDMESRIQRAVKEYGVPAANARKELERRDKERSSHCRHYTDQIWGEARNYHITMNSAYLGIDTCVDVICRAAQR